MSSPLTTLGVTNPVLAAPLAGGPSTPDLVIGAGRAGSLGFVAAGYKSIDALSEQIRSVRASGLAFGVNLFAPNPVPISQGAYEAYSRRLQPDADAYGIDLSEIGLREDDDQWEEKLALLLADPVPVVSFTFGIPSAGVIAALRKAGTITVQTVTSAIEARQAAAVGVDLLALQSAAAGGHSGTLTPQTIPPATPLTELIRQVAAVVSLPIIGTGGIATADAVTGAIAAGADAVAVGTVLLRADESGASAPHRAALADPAAGPTILTRAFTGRPARALRNIFTDKFTDVAPAGYPAVHHLTSSLRKAAAAAGDAERIHLWAGTGFAAATEEPIGQILARLASRL
jgi:nitronate monooxygenase